MNEIISTELYETAFFDYADMTLKTVSDSSARIYSHVYQKWLQWTAAQGASPLELKPSLVIRFLEAQPVTKTTRSNYLSALRKLSSVMALDLNYPHFEQHDKALRMIRVPTRRAGGTKRSKTALNPEDVIRMLQYWSLNSNLGLRNAAIIHTLFGTGMRRGELAALEWRHFDHREGVIHIEDGKGGKDRDVAIVLDSAVILLERLQETLPGRRYVFCPTVPHSGAWSDDVPVSDDVIYNVIKETAIACGMTNVTTHDGRRTIATELLLRGASLADVQRQLGHTNESTTLSYAQASDAATRRKRFHVRYDSSD